MYLCIDIGGTSIKYGVLEESHEAVRFVIRHEISTDAKSLKGPGIEQKIVELARGLRAQYEIRGIAISTAGMVDADTGEIIYANENIPEYTGINLKITLEREFGLPCAVENDVNAAALGEYAYGAGQGSRSLLCMTVGTGIGGALIMNGAVYHGHSGSAGEIGYMCVSGEEFQKNASTTALVLRVQERQKADRSIDGRKIFERAKRGDVICKEEIAKTCDSLAQGIANCLCLMNPEMVVLGGGIMAQKEYLRPLIEYGLQKYVNPYILKHTRWDFAKLGNDAGMIGAYYKLKREADGSAAGRQ